MDFPRFTFSKKYTRSSVEYELLFDFELRENTGHNKKTFDGYKSLIQYLENHCDRKIYITQTQTTNSYEEEEKIVINLACYQDFWRRIGQSGQDRTQAFLAQRVQHYSEKERHDVISASTPEQIVESTKDFTEQQKNEFVRANATERNIIETIRQWPESIQANILHELQGTPTPNTEIALVSKSEQQIIAELSGKDVPSVINIIKGLSDIPNLQLSKEDLNIVLKRRKKLAEFQSALTTHADDEGWWQEFFEKNKWIFGYGLNYQILKQEQTQPNYGGTSVDGQGGRRGDYLASTEGDINFTVLVEIKKPSTGLIQGSAEIRNGAWSLSRDLTDALSQIEANLHTWQIDGSRQDANRDRLEAKNVHTVQPKGIIVIGSLQSLGNDRNKRETFQRFRKSIHGIDIITFDELFSRAQFIIESAE